MKRVFNPSTMSYEVDESFKALIQIPDESTAAQNKEFDEYLDSVMVNPLGLVSEAFERIFNEPYDDGSEDIPNELEGAVE